MVSQFIWKKEFLFARELTLENSAGSYLCFQQALLSQYLTSFSSINYLFCLCAQFSILFYVTWMRSSRSTHLLMFLSVETLMSIISTGKYLIFSNNYNTYVNFNFNFRFRKFILKVQTSKVISINHGSSLSSWKLKS